MALAQPRTSRGLTTTTGTPAAAKIPVIGISNPAVASNTSSVEGAPPSGVRGSAQTRRHRWMQRTVPPVGGQCLTALWTHQSRQRLVLSSFHPPWWSSLVDMGSTAQVTVRALLVKGMTTLAVPRSLRTAAPSVYHARVDDAQYHCRLECKVQGYRKNILNVKSVTLMG